MGVLVLVVASTSALGRSEFRYRWPLAVDWFILLDLLAASIVGIGLIMFGLGRIVRGAILLMSGIVIVGWRTNTSHSIQNEVVVLLGWSAIIGGAALIAWGAFRLYGHQRCPYGHRVQRRERFCAVCGTSLRRVCRNDHVLDRRDAFCATCGEPAPDLAAAERAFPLAT